MELEPPLIRLCAVLPLKLATLPDRSRTRGPRVCADLLDYCADFSIYVLAQAHGAQIAKDSNEQPTEK